MVSLQKYRNKKIAIYGMGLTGLSTARVLKKSGVKIFCWDDNIKIRNKIRNLKFPLKKFWQNKNTVDNIVISPGIDINRCKIKNYLRRNPIKIITDLDLFFDINKKGLIVSVTGTNGKSTTCKIIEKILKTAKYKVSTLGNIGKPILSFNQNKKKSVFIIEVSSYQLQYSKLFRSHHAAILNISPDHLERHKNLKNYIKIKSKIFFAQNKSDYSYINSSNKYSKIIKKIFKKNKLKSKLISINSPNKNFLINNINNKYFSSKGNIENMIFAFEIAKNLKVKESLIIKALNRFKGLPHRQEIVFSRANLLCINDSKATSFEACLQSLSNYQQIYWIAGGLPKLKDQLYLKGIKKRIVKAYIIGKSISFFKKQIGKNVAISVSKNMKAAVNNILKDIKLNKRPKKTILLSPGAASFDQFKNFEDRGNYFKKVIKEKLKGN